MDDTILPATQTQEYSGEPVDSTIDEAPRPWGRLASCVPELESIDLFELRYSFGRAPQCNIIIEKNFGTTILINISKIHFELLKIEDVVYLQDLSKNGTFLNGHKIGKDTKQIIGNNDAISVGNPNDKVYIFYDCFSDDIYLPSELKEKYYLSKLLGKGAFGEVRLAVKKRTQIQYAIKRIFKQTNSDVPNSKLTDQRKIKTEIDILASYTYPFIISMIEVFETEREVFLVLEYLRGGELKSRITDLSRPFPENEIKFVFYQILLGLRYLHLHGVTHRDIKAENVLLMSNSYFPIVKISDFGLSKILEDVSLMETICGTISYVAPEILLYKHKYCRKVDVWSLGVLLFYMLSRSLPFIGSDRASVARKIISRDISVNLKSWKVVSSDASDLVYKMLTVAPARRINILQIFRHYWISSDTAMKNKVQNFIDQQSSDVEDSEDIIPPTKRPRLYSSPSSSISFI